MGKRKLGEVCFQIHGDFLTEHSRALVREGNWRHAVKTLKDGLIGVNSDQCYEILAGRKQLVGVNDLDYIDDDKHLNSEWLAAHYYPYFRNVFWFEGGFYKPYGYVNNLNADDLSLAMDRLGYKVLPFESGFSGDAEVIDLNCERADTYKRISTDFVFHSKSLHKWVLSETLDSLDYPVWLTSEEARSLSRENLNIEHSLDDNELEDIAIKRNTAKSIRDTPDFSTPQDQNSMLDSYISDQKKVDDLFSNPGKVKKQIAEQADKVGGWLELYNKKTGAKYRIPKNPFYRWCLSESSIYDSIEWKCVSPRGAKMGGDDPNHTDWYLFTMLPMGIAQDHDNPETQFFYKMRHKYMAKLSGADLVVLSNIKKHKGFKKAVVRHLESPDQIDFINKNDVIIIPSASPDFEAVAHKCAENNCILISETGGKLCHLATVGREFGLALFMLPNAGKKFPMACSVTIDCEKGTIEALDMDISVLMPLKLTGMRYR